MDHATFQQSIPHQIEQRLQVLAALYETNGQLHCRETGRYVDNEYFRYDPAANRLNDGTSKFDAVKDNRLKTLNGVDFNYDAWGNTVSKHVQQFATDWQEFEYDAENRLVHTRHWIGAYVASEGWYQYDSLGRRTKKTATTPEHPEPTEKTFEWQGLRLLQEQTPDGQSLYVYEPNSYAPLAGIDNVEGEEQKTYYLHTDQIGTPLEMTDAEGRIVWQATFKSWGEMYSLDVGQVEQNLRFQGQYFDAESGLHYNTFRYYDPKVGRFTTQDPIGLDGGSNLYEYSENPIACVDPWGLSAKPAHSPDMSKWLEKGGPVHSEIEGRTWVYSDWEGNTVRYPNGHPDFTPFARQQVDVPNLKGNHGRNPGGDFGKAGALAPKGAADYANNTWHHHENMRTMQEVPRNVHSRFTHSGGVKSMKSAC